MFTLNNVDYNKQGVCCTFKFRLPGTVVTERTITLEGAVRTVQRKYLENAFDYLGFAFDQLLEEVSTIKKHFFDKTAEPYLECSGYWIKSYWQLSDAVEKFRKAQKERNIKDLKEAIHAIDLKGLDPDFNFPNREVILELTKDLLEVSAECAATWKKLI